MWQVSYTMRLSRFSNYQKIWFVLDTFYLQNVGSNLSPGQILFIFAFCPYLLKSTSLLISYQNRYDIFNKSLFFISSPWMRRKILISILLLYRSMKIPFLMMIQHTFIILIFLKEWREKRIWNMVMSNFLKDDHY